MMGVAEIKEPRCSFVSLGVFDGHRCKDLVFFERVKLFGRLFEGYIGQDFSSDCPCCLFSQRRLLAVRLAFLETSFEYKSMLEHCGIEFESRVIDKLPDFFSGENLFLPLSVSVN